MTCVDRICLAARRVVKIPAWIGLVLLCSFASLRHALAQGVNCVNLLPLFQRGLSDEEVAAAAQIPLPVARSCRHELTRPLPVGPSGAPPMGAAGPPPAGAAGKPPMGAAGAPPVGAPGPPPVGNEMRRLPPR